MSSHWATFLATHKYMEIKKLLKDKSYVNLDLGEIPQKGFLLLKEAGAHFDKLPWPFPDSSIDLIRADNIISKVRREGNQFIKFMDECWRILKNNGEFMIATPYAGSYQFYQDPLNINPCNECTFAYFDPLEPIAGQDLYKLYKPKPWKIKHMSFQLNGMMEVLLEKRKEDVSYGR